MKLAGLTAVVMTLLAGMAALIISAPLIFDQFTGLVSEALDQTESVLVR